MKGDIIKGYCLTSDWKVVGGMSEVAFAEKDGKEWFIKKFISPKFPTPDSPGNLFLQSFQLQIVLVVIE